jgi:hypothetical protein
MLAASLPHRTDSERQRIGSGLLGVATWQYVCATHELAWPPAPDLTQKNQIAANNRNDRAHATDHASHQRCLRRTE